MRDTISSIEPFIKWQNLGSRVQRKFKPELIFFVDEKDKIDDRSCVIN